MIKPNPTLDKLCSFLGSVRGTDKVLMFVQYFSKLVIWRLKATDQKSSFAVKVSNLASPVSDFRILLRYYGLVPMLQWIIASENFPNKNVKIQWLIRLQNISNVIYYPLEHIYWLAAHNIISMTDKMRDKIGIWSCRFWMAYVVLYFMQLREEYMDTGKEIRSLKSKTLKDSKDPLVVKSRLDTIKIERKTWAANLLVNSAYFPLTLHWSSEQGILNDAGVGICGLVASFGQLYLAWKSIS